MGFTVIEVDNPDADKSYRSHAARLDTFPFAFLLLGHRLARNGKLRFGKTPGFILCESQRTARVRKYRPAARPVAESESGCQVAEGIPAPLSYVGLFYPRELFKELKHRCVVDLAKELGKRYRVALLTNATSGFFREIMKRNHLDGIFDPVVISSVERAAKPDRVIYERVLDRMNVPAGRALMIDDNPTNILGAQSAGMDGIVFESAARLKNILAERGCLIGVPGYRS